MKRLFRKCVKCGKRNQTFHVSTGWKSGFASYCVKCRSKWRKKNPRYKQQNAAARDRAKSRARQYCYDYLTTHPCVDCGVTDPTVLTFDHVRGRKYLVISRMIVNGCGLPKIQREIDKCEVRCANCHFRKTAKQLGFWKASQQFGSA